MWIGFYEGKYVKCDDVKFNIDILYMWEVCYIVFFLFVKVCEIEKWIEID